MAHGLHLERVAVANAGRLNSAVLAKLAAP
jgi:hypothetical protein